MPTDTENLILAFDLGGASVKAQLFQQLPTRVVAVGLLITHPSHADGSPIEILDAVTNAGYQAVADAGASINLLSRLAAAVPGPFDFDCGCFKREHRKYHSLYGVDFAAMLGGDFGVPISFVGDMDAMAYGVLAEPSLSFVRDSNVLVVSLGTNMAQAEIANGEVVTPDKITDKNWNEAARNTVETADDIELVYLSRWVTTRFGVPPNQLAYAAKIDDPFALDAYNEIGDAIGRSVSSFIETTPADHVVFTGGMAKSFHLMASSINAALPASVATHALDPSPSTKGAILAINQRG